MAAATVAEVGGGAPGSGGRGSPLFLAGGGGRGTWVARLFKVTPTSSYSTGGEDISSIFNRFKVVTDVSPIVFLDARGAGRLYQVDYSAKKLKVYTAFGTEASSTSDQSGQPVYALFIGIPA